MRLKDLPMITPATANLPKYRQIAAVIEEYLLCANPPAGERFFSDRALAQTFSTTPVTVAHALNYLTEKGLLTRRPGSGTYVGKKAPVYSSHRRIGIICHEMVSSDEMYIKPVLKKFGEFFESHNYECISVRGEPDDYRRLINDYLLAGIMVFVPKEEFAAPLQELYNDGVPVVSVGYAMPQIPHISFGTDHVQSVNAAMRYLYQLGHRKIAILCNMSQASGSVFLRSYRQAMWDLKLPIHPMWEIILREAATNIFEQESRVVEHENLQTLLNTENMPSAILIKNVFDAVSMYSFAAKNNLRIPEDLSLISFDDAKFLSQLHPPLTVMAQNLEAITDNATNALLAMIEGNSDRFSPRPSPSQLIERSSCSSVKSS